MAQDRPKMPPRSLQDGLRERLVFLIVFVFDFGRFGVDFWLHLGSPNRPSSDRALRLVEPKATKVDPWVPKMLQEPPNRHPRPPKSAKEPPKMTQDPLKTTQDACKMPPNDPKLPQDASKTPFSPCLSSFLFLSLSLSLSLSFSLLLFRLPFLFSLFCLLSSLHALFYLTAGGSFTYWGLLSRSWVLLGWS